MGPHVRIHPFPLQEGEERASALEQRVNVLAATLQNLQDGGHQIKMTVLVSRFNHGG